jgi:uncharacterized membrane protein YdjX (TVP38/TMEM64 family)
MALFYYSGLYKHISFKNFQDHQEELKNWIASYPILAPLVYVTLYIIITAFMIPVGILFSLLGGYLFPQPLSTFYVVTGASLGASIIFIAAKTALKDALEKRARPFFHKMKTHFQKNAVGYLLFLRFTPFFPFWAVNIAPAFFRIPLWTFAWTTFVGIIPGSFALTLFGSGIEISLESTEPFSVRSLFTPQFIIAISLLSCLSLSSILYKKLKAKK